MGTLSEEVWSYFTISENDAPFIDSDDDILEHVVRKDGFPMTEDDVAALIPYGGFVSLMNTIMTTPFVGDEDEPPTTAWAPDGPNELSEDEDDADFFGLPVTRRDGAPMDCSDSEALLEFGGLTSLFVALKTTSVIGDLEASPTGGRMDHPAWARNQGRCPDQFEGIERVDGSAFDAEDEAALLPYQALMVICKFLDFLTVPPLGLFPEPNDNLTALGELWGKQQAEREKAYKLEHQDRTDGADDEALLHYSAWAKVGGVLLAIYRKTVGDLGTLANTSGNGKSTQNTLKRKPSGAELSAWIGKATHASLGLADPKRKVHARAVI
mmetsp:Transcript_37651/g.68824  ORF Transcript_37651/g.68824 Transcript_37651/m.68824 type:complete len:325 (+) Transcript_37651:82-1056(+)